MPERLTADEALLMAVLDRPHGAFIGLTMLFGHDPGRRRAEIGFWLAPGARGRGIAAAAVGLTLRWAVDGVGLARVEGLTAADNVGARRAMEAAGMQADPTVSVPQRREPRAGTRYVAYLMRTPG